MVLTTRYRPEYPARDVIEGVPVYRIPPYNLSKLGVIGYYLHFLAYLIFKRRTYDLLHLTWAGWITFLAPGLLGLLGKKTVFTSILYGYDDPGRFRKMRHGKLKLRLMEKTDRILTVSRALYDAWQTYGFSEERLSWIPLGPSPEHFYPLEDEAGRGALREKLGLPTGKKIVLYAGIITHRKGADIAIEVWKKAAKERDDTVLVMVGAKSNNDNRNVDDRFIEGLKREIRGSGLDPKVLLIGQVDGPGKMGDFYRAADLFFFPSRREGLPNTLLEAMACGLPPVVSLLPGSTDRVVIPGEDGFLIETEDISGYVKAINRLLDDERMGREMGVKAARRISDDFSYEDYVQKHIELYEKLLAGR